MTFNAGESVGPYRIVAQLGQGGMATVYKAYHAALDRYVALKVLHPAFMEDQTFLSRFQREAKLVAKLDHPNIVPIYDYAEHEGRPYLVMKFIEGETLKARLAAGMIPAGEIVRIVEAVGAALAYAHHHGILHRDIKPSNVILANDGGIYLADFGLARIAASGESTLSTDMVMGTPQYISPEQALGKKDLDEGTDIYSFGVMLYELVVGKVPFSADTPFSIIHDHIYTPLPLPRQVNPEVTEELERVLLKALAKERADRYPDVASLVTAFEQAWQVERTTGESAPESTLKAEAPTLLQEQVTPEPAAVLPLPASPAPPPMETGAQAAAPAAGATVGPGSFTLPKRNFPWMWLAAGLLLLLGCIVTVLAFYSVRKINVPTSQAASLPGPTNLPTPLPALPVNPTVPAGGPPPTVLPVGQALALVAKNPNDPDAHAQLGLAYLAAGRDKLAQDQVTAIEKLSPNEATYWWIGREFAASSAWLMAARLCVDAVEKHPAGLGPLPADQKDLLHETVFKAFKEASAPDFIAFTRLSAVDGPLSQVAQARFTFYNKDQVQGQNILTQVIQSNPDLPEAQLLQAEIYAKLGKSAAARQSLANLSKNPLEADWMRAVAETIQGAIP